MWFKFPIKVDKMPTQKIACQEIPKWKLKKTNGKYFENKPTDDETKLSILEA